MAKYKKKYTIGTKNAVKKNISKELDKKIKNKMKDLKKKVKDPSKITYIYASHILGGGK